MMLSASVRGWLKCWQPNEFAGFNWWLWEEGQNIGNQIGLLDLIGIYKRMTSILATKWVCQILLATLKGCLDYRFKRNGLKVSNYIERK